MIASLRGRLLLGTALISAGALCILGAALDAAVRRTMLADFDTAMRAKAKSLASMVEQHNRRIAFEFDPDAMPEFSASRDPEYFEIWLENKEFVRSGSLKTAELPFARAGAAETAQSSVLPDGRRGRALSISFFPYTEPDPRPDAASRKSTVRGSMTVARDTRELDQTLAHLRWTALLLLVLAVLFTGGGLVWVVHRATRPLRRLADSIDSLNESDLDQRLSAAGVPSELVPVVERLNGLLSRLSAAFARERAFTADVAHELRTPLAGVRTTLEVCRTRPRESAGYEVAIDKSLSQIAGLSSLVENLLLLARAEAGQLALNPASIDFGSFLEDCRCPFSVDASARGLTFKFCLPERCTVACDPRILRIVLNNLLDNAVSHADADSEIVVRACATATAVTFAVSNTASQLRDDDLAKLFNRFWRGDESRSHTGRHAGLGLSLCRRLLGLAGTSIEVDLSDDRKFTAQVILPRDNNAIH